MKQHYISQLKNKNTVFNKDQTFMQHIPKKKKTEEGKENA